MFGVAIVPMGFCFPGLDAKGSDLPPRQECAATWHHALFQAMPQLELVLLVGGYAQRWHLANAHADAKHATSQTCRPTLTETVAAWREIYAAGAGRRCLPLPHPSWRNNGWLKANPWFEADLLPTLRHAVAAAT
jgi:uracil-DNA glycosylase